MDDLPLRGSEDIQGNVLAAFNKDHQTLLLYRLPEDGVRARAWLAEIEPLVSATREVEDFNEEYSRRRRAGESIDELAATWVGLGLTASGLRRLTADPDRLEADLASLLPNRRPPVDGDSLSFVVGPAARASVLGDEGPSAPPTWEFGGPSNPPVDAVVTVAADRPADLDDRAETIREIARRHGVAEVFKQKGETLPGPAVGHEHFGYKDGISQPGVRGFHAPDPARPDERLGHPGATLVAAGEFVLGHPDETGATAAVPEWMRDGSFQVVRRLAQDVPGWWGQVHQARAGRRPAQQEELGAKLFGRWRSGAPLALHPDADPGTAGSGANDFGFQADDADFQRTPAGAHIRKMYPRDSQPPGAAGSDLRRIMRRGIPYGLPFNPSGGRDQALDAERGLVFVCFNASIEHQFEFLQKFWANNPGFPSKDQGRDPVIGADGPLDAALPRLLAGSTFLLRLWLLLRSLVSSGSPRSGNLFALHTPAGVEFVPLRRFVITRGALYCFAPSRAALRRIAGGEV